MKAEFQKLIKFFEELEEAGETATLTLSTRGGKSTIKLQLESSPSLPATLTTSTHTLPPASGQRRRHRGARARARRNQRAAAHQTSLAEAAASAPLVPPLPLRPLCPLQSPSPSTGRRQVISLASQPLPSFSNLNLDGPPPSPPPQPHQSPLPGTTPTCVPSSSPSPDTWCPRCEEFNPQHAVLTKLSSKICPGCSQLYRLVVPVGSLGEWLHLV